MGKLATALLAVLGGLGGGTASLVVLWMVVMPTTVSRSEIPDLVALYSPYAPDRLLLREQLFTISSKVDAMSLKVDALILQACSREPIPRE